MKTPSIEAAPAAAALRRRALGALALGLVGAEAAVAALGGDFELLSGAALLLAPGLAFTPLLPRPLRAHPAATLAAVPALGLALSSIALITVASTGIRLEAGVIRGTLATLVLAGLLLPQHRRPPGGAPTGAGRLGAIGLLGAVIAGVLLENRVIGGSPVPGNDWAKYVLYADEIRRQGGLLIDNPYWMLGSPFSEDPAVPSLYGAFLELTGAPAAVLMHGIWVFAVMGILSVYAFVRAFWGETAGVIGAFLWAIVPMTQDILGWHGLANTAALALLPLLLAYLTALAQRGLDRTEAAGLGLLLVGLAACHRLSFLVGASVVALTLLVTVLRTRERRAVLTAAAVAGATALVLAPGVAYDLINRGRSFGGTQGYTAYLDTKINWKLVGYDLTIVLSAVALAALVVAIRRVRRDASLAPLLCLLAVILALGYGWLFHFPVSYLRMAYFLPLVAVPLVAIALARAPVRWAAVAGALLVLAVFARAWDQTENVRRYYAFANPASLRGLDTVAERLRPGEVVVTDRCWSFLSTWLLHTPTLPALEREDILPQIEVARAQQARQVLAGTGEGHRLANRLGVRYMLVDPTCRDSRGRLAQPPTVGVPLFASERLAILEFPRRSRARPDPVASATAPSN